MAEIIDFIARRNEKLRGAPAVTISELSAQATQFLLGDWEKMARANRLNDYFRQSMPSSVDQFSKINYMNDLNEIAKLELNLDLRPMIFFPGTTHRTQIGWVVQFKLANTTVLTPELASEAYARCFSILLFLRVKRAALDARLI